MPGQPWGAKPKPSGPAVASLVVGIVSCCVWLVPFIGLFLVPAAGAVAAILGIVALRKTKEGMGGKGLAIAGLTLGMVSVVAFLLLWFVMVPLLDEMCAAQPDTGTCREYLQARNLEPAPGSDSHAQATHGERPHADGTVGRAPMAKRLFPSQAKLA